MQHASLKGLEVNIKIRLVANFLRKLSNEMIIPYMTIYLAQSFGASISASVIFVILLSGIGSSLQGGLLADKFSCKKILVSCEGLHMFSLLGLVLGIYYQNFTLIFISYFLKNIFVTLATASSEAIIIDASQSWQRPLIYSLSKWSNSLSIPLGATAGAFLYYSHFNETLCFTIFISLLVFLSYCFLEDKNKVMDSQRQENSIKAYKVVFADKKYTLFLLSSLLLFGIEFQFFNYIPVYFSKISNAINVPFWNSISGVELYGLLRSENTLMIIFLTPVLIGLIKKIGNDTTSIISLHVFYVLSFSLFTIYINPYVSFLCVAMLSIGEVMLMPTRQALMSEMIPEANRGKYLSAFHLAARGGNIVSVVFFFLSSYLNPIFITLGILIMGIASTYLYLATTERRVVVSTF